jgi:uncharacterized RDD family membrane protein YckC
MSAIRQSTLTIETPEGVVFSYALATPVTRALAWSIDALAIAAATMLAGKAIQSFAPVSADWANAISLLAYLVISIGYGIALEWRWRGQTLGKRVLGLRVIDAQGLRLQLPQIALRNLLRFADMLPLLYLTGGIAALVTRKCQRLGDLAANTVVAHEREWQRPDLEQIAPARYNSLAAWPNHAARLRSLASTDAVALAVRALAHRDGYDPSARIGLFADLAAYFRGLVRFPEPALEGLTDEQYLRSVLRVIYGQTR